VVEDRILRHVGDLVQRLGATGRHLAGCIGG